MTYAQISFGLGIGIMTACKCVHECTYAICRHMFSTYIHLPTPAEARINMEKWKQQTSIPGIIGAIDGTHIAIKRPCEHGNDYYNRKAHYSVNMQGSSYHVARLMITALVDYKKRFLDVEIGWPGSVGDNRVFDNSYLSHHYEGFLAELGTTLLATGDDVSENIPAFILGDSAYRNTRHFVTTSELAIGRSCRPSQARPDRDFMLRVGIGLSKPQTDPGTGRIGLSQLKCRSGPVQTKIWTGSGKGA